MQIRHLPRHCCPVLDNVGNIRLASLEYYTMSMYSTITVWNANSNNYTINWKIVHLPWPSSSPLFGIWWVWIHKISYSFYFFTLLIKPYSVHGLNMTVNIADAIHIVVRSMWEFHRMGVRKWAVISMRCWYNTIGIMEYNIAADVFWNWCTSLCMQKKNCEFFWCLNGGQADSAI